jgi:uncharacterized protein YkwD
MTALCNGKTSATSKATVLFPAVLGTLFLLCGPISAQALEELFVARQENAETCGPVDSAIVMRQRPVDVRFQSFYSEEGEQGFADVLILNLFPDVTLTAIQNSVEKSGSEGFAWNGVVEEEGDSEVTLVVGGARLSGAVELPGAIYHIRPIGSDVHCIREIDPMALPVSKAPSEGRKVTTSPALDGMHNLEYARVGAAAATDVLPEEQQLLNLVNEERAINGLMPLNADARLITAARNHSQDMADNVYFSHMSQDNRMFSQRISDAGYSWNRVAENIGYGYTTPAAIVNAWLNSPGHRANMLDPNYCDGGPGYAIVTRPYWTLDLAREQGVYQCPQ